MSASPTLAPTPPTDVLSSPPRRRRREVTLPPEKDPQRFPSWRKWVIVLAVNSASLCATWASSCASFTETGMSQEFHVSKEATILGISLYVEGLGWGPLLVGPLSEVYGRTLIYRTSYAVFFLLNLPVVFAPDLATYLVFRFLTGFSASAFLSVSGGTASDLFDDAHVGNPMTITTLAPFLGPVVGPLISGFINQNLYWRWTYRILLTWVFVETVILFLFVPETYAPVLLKWEAQRLRKEQARARSDPEKSALERASMTKPPILDRTMSPDAGRTSTSKRPINDTPEGDKATKEDADGEPRPEEVDVEDGGEEEVYAPVELDERGVFARIVVSCYRPFQLMLFDRMALLLNIWSALVLGILYLAFQAFPIIFEDGHGFSVQQTGLAFLGIGIGMVGAGLTQPVWNRVFKRATTKHGGTAPPETRLYMGQLGAVLVPVGLFWLAFTTYPSVHWIVPIVASLFFGAGVYFVFAATFTYLVSAYRPIAASAMAANSATRSAFAAVFPLFAPAMYERLGTVGATALLAGLASVMAPLPFVFFRIGGRLRKRSRFAQK